MSTTLTERQISRMQHNLLQQMIDHRNAYLAHNAVHYDRSECGGVGGCALLRLEVDLQNKVTEALEVVYERGLNIGVIIIEASSKTLASAENVAKGDE